MTTPAQPLTPSQTAPTSYVILEATDQPETWKVIGTETARDANQAIKQHLAGDGDVDGEFNAVPARSWKPVSVKTEIALKFGGES